MNPKVNPRTDELWSLKMAENGHEREYRNAHRRLAEGDSDGLAAVWHLASCGHNAIEILDPTRAGQVNSDC